MKIVTTRGIEHKVEEAEVDNLSSGLGGITRSGKCYTSEELEKRRKELGTTVKDPLKKKITKGEVEDFLRIIKNTKYSVVKQINKMPVHISVLQYSETDQQDACAHFSIVALISFRSTQESSCESPE